MYEEDELFHHFPQAVSTGQVEHGVALGIGDALQRGNGVLAAKELLGNVRVAIHTCDVQHRVALVVAHAEVEVVLGEQGDYFVVRTDSRVRASNVQRSVAAAVLNVQVRLVRGGDQHAKDAV